VAPAMDRTYPLDDVAAAMRRLLDGRANGKIVIQLPPPSAPTADPRRPQ
jgi:NADPH:quinone reductase-like Zn-dependent oxidoreductase